MKPFVAGLCCFFISLLILFPLTRLWVVYEVSEAREGVVVDEMLKTREYVLPLRHGSVVPSKPPLFHWICVVGVKTFGTFDELTLRFPSILSASAIVGVASAFACSFLGWSAAYTATLLLLSCYGFIQLALDGRVDMLFCFWVTTAQLVWLSALARHGSLRAIPEFAYHVIGILVGLSVLTKGPLGVVLPILFIGSFSLLQNSGAISWKAAIENIRSLVRWGWIWTVLVPLPWYVAATFKGSENFVGRQLIFENVSRFLGGEGITPKPAWFYLTHFFSHSLPWGLFLPVVLYFHFQSRKDSPFNSTNPEEQKSLSMLRRAMLVWMGVFIFFLSLSTGKRDAYLLMLMPALCLYLVLMWPLLQSSLSSTFSAFLESPRLSRIVHHSSHALLALSCAFCALVALTLIPGLPSYFGQYGYIVLTAVQGNRFEYLGIVISLIFAVWTCHRQFTREKSVSAFGNFVWLGLQVILVALVCPGIAFKGITHTYRDFAAQVSTRVPESESLSFIKTPKEESFDAFFFYMHRRVKLFDPNSTPENPGYYLARREWISKQSETWKNRVQEIYEGGRMVDAPEKRAVLFRLNPVNAETI